MASSAEGGSAAAASMPYSCDIDVKLGSEEHAAMVCTTLAVDKEVMPDKVSKSYTTDGCTVKIHISATEARFLRTVVSSTHDMLGVAVRTLQEFA